MGMYRDKIVVRWPQASLTAFCSNSQDLDYFNCSQTSQPFSTQGFLSQPVIDDIPIDDVDDIELEDADAKMDGKEDLLLRNSTEREVSEKCAAQAKKAILTRKRTFKRSKTNTSDR